MESVVVFIDDGNLAQVLEGEKVKLDLLVLRNYLAEGRSLTEVFFYPSIRHATKAELRNSLTDNGFLVRLQSFADDQSPTEDNGIQLVMDILDYVSLSKVDIVVIVTGDRDYAPLANWLRFRGIRVEVASTKNGISQNLRRAANGFIDLCRVLEDPSTAEEAGSLSSERR